MDLLVPFALFSVPVLLGWTLADGSRRKRIRIPQPIVTGTNALYTTLVGAPIAFVAFFTLLIARAWFVAGHAPVLGHLDDMNIFQWIGPSPDPSDMPIHAWTVLVLFFASHAAVVLLAALWPILRVERGESLRKIARVFVPGYLLVWVVILSQPFYLDDWLIGSLLR